VHEEVARAFRGSRELHVGLSVTWCLLRRRGMALSMFVPPAPGAQYGTQVSPCTATRTPPAERHTDDRCDTRIHHTAKQRDGQTSQRSSSYLGHPGGGNETRVRFPPPPSRAATFGTPRIRFGEAPSSGLAGLDLQRSWIGNSAKRSCPWRCGSWTSFDAKAQWRRGPYGVLGRTAAVRRSSTRGCLLSLRSGRRSLVSLFVSCRPLRDSQQDGDHLGQTVSRHGRRSPLACLAGRIDGKVCTRHVRGRHSSGQLSGVGVAPWRDGLHPVRSLLRDSTYVESCSGEPQRDTTDADFRHEAHDHSLRAFSPPLTRSAASRSAEDARRHQGAGSSTCRPGRGSGRSRVARVFDDGLVMRIFAPFGPPAASDRFRPRAS
jgi:hypothetical protein